MLHEATQHSFFPNQEIMIFVSGSRTALENIMATGRSKQGQQLQRHNLQQSYNSKIKQVSAPRSGAIVSIIAPALLSLCTRAIGSVHHHRQSPNLGSRLERCHSHLPPLPSFRRPLTAVKWVSIPHKATSPRCVLSSEGNPLRNWTDVRYQKRYQPGREVHPPCCALVAGLPKSFPY